MRAAGRSGEGSAAPFPWVEAMGFGLGVLRLAPRDFWAMSPRELAAAVSARQGRGAASPPLDRAGLADLMQRFPDGHDQGLR